MSLHPVLRRQLRRLGLDVAAPPTAADWEAFLQRVSTSYTDADNERYLTERALAVSSREMRELYEARTHSELRQAALREVATAVAGGRDPAAVADLVLSAAAALMPEVEASVRWVQPGEVEAPPPDLPGYVVAAITGGTAHQAAGAAGVDLAVPAVASGVVRAVILAEAVHDPDDVERMLTDLADLLALSAMNAEATQQLAARADTDALTGLANHRVFQERLELEVRRAQRHGRALSLIVGDIDEFKQVNDTYGHQAGDTVLVAAAAMLAGLARGSDLVARIGGEEFAVILPETDGIGAVSLAERIRRTIAAEPLPPVGRVTISLGVCSLGDADYAHELLNRADAAMYWSKANGRNMTFRWTAENAARMGITTGAEGTQRIRALTAVRALARAVEDRNPFLRRHSDRVADLAHALAIELGWPQGRANALRQVALIHDVGKVGLPERLLAVADPLTPEELARVRNHTRLGAELVAELMDAEQVSWIHAHHERVDGTGYPDGLPVERIPEGALVLAVADTWDALTSDRPYRSACAHDIALDECRRVAGTQLWEPAVAALERLVAQRAVDPPAQGAGEAVRAPASRA